MTEQSPIDRAPALPTYTVALAVVVFVVGVASLEVFALERGIEPLPTDSAMAWARTYHTGFDVPDGIVLLGSSRAALGVDPAVLSEGTGRPVFNLTINGGNPLPVLERLARDGYAGTVVIELMERRYFATDEVGHRTTIPYVGELDNPSLISDGEDRVRAALAQVFRTRSAPMRLNNLLRSALTRSLPEPAARYTRADRFVFTDIARIDRAALEDSWVDAAEHDPPLPEPEWHDVAAHLDDLQDAFSARGGGIRWVRLPSSGRVAEIENVTYPRNAAFDLIGTPSTRWHYTDDPRTRELSCFDGSHLAPAEAEALTQSLAAWLTLRATL